MSGGRRKGRFDFSDEGLAQFQQLLAEEGLAEVEDRQIPRRSPADPLRLSYAQERLWFLQQWEPESARYNVSSALRLSGRLSVGALTRAFATVVKRHEILRIGFPAPRGRPVQEVLPEVTVALPLIDLTALSSERRATEVRSLTRRQSRLPFDLTSPPLLQIWLLRLEEEEHGLLITCHHIVCDGWSMGVLVREIVAHYEAFSRGESPDLADLQLQYPDYALWQRRRIEEEAEGRRELAHWRRVVEDYPQTLELPTDRPRPTVLSDRGSRVDRALPRDLSERILEAARQWRATPFMVFLAGFEAVLSRHAGQNRFLVGTPIANRDRPEVEPLIGCFVNTLVLPADLSGKPSFADLVARTRHVAIDAQDHQGVPFERILEEVAPERNLSHTPLFQVLFAFQNAAPGFTRGGGLAVRDLGVPTTAAKFDLLLSVEEIEGRFLTSLEYAVDLFERTTAQRFVAQLRRLLEGGLQHPKAPWDELDLQGAAERQQVLVEWNDAAVAGWGRDVLHDAIERQAVAAEDRVAVSCESGHLSYGELLSRVGRLAAVLRSFGVGRGDVVGVCQERSVEMVTAVLSVLWAGGAYLPLDPDDPEERLRFMVADARVGVVLVGTGRQKWADLGTGVELVEVPKARHRHGGAAPTAAVPVAPEDRAYVIYTSGSTGRPKGVEVQHGSIVNRLEWMQAAYRLGPRDAVLQKTPTTFDVSVWELFWPLRCGGRLAVAHSGGHRAPAYLVAEVERERVTVMHFVPSMLRLFAAEPELERCRSLRQVIASGEALPADLVRAFRRRVDSRLDNLYGPTEASVDVTSWRCRSDATDVPIGRPIANTELYVLDGDLRPVPRGVVGELCIGGVGVA
ncbi:MAG: amino acid adenylation domain-containing protein, partial [bacterium]